MVKTNLQLQRHFQADTFPRIERLRQSEKALQRRLLRVHRIYNFLYFTELINLIVYIFTFLAKVNENIGGIRGQGISVAFDQRRS